MPKINNNLRKPNDSNYHYLDGDESVYKSNN